MTFLGVAQQNSEFDTRLLTVNATSGFVAVSLVSALARVAEWQTRWLQVPVPERVWGFKSPLAHSFLQVGKHALPVGVFTNLWM